GLGSGVVTGEAIAYVDVACSVAKNETLERRRVVVVGVDSGERAAHVHRSDVLDDEMPLVLRVAVAARAVQLAEVAHEEVLDDDGSRSVVLKNLVSGVHGATAVDGHRF